MWHISATNSAIWHSENNPISCEDVPAIDNIAAREGMEQRVVPTGAAGRDNAANIGIGFFELSTMQYHMYDTTKQLADGERPIWGGGKSC